MQISSGHFWISHTVFPAVPVLATHFLKSYREHCSTSFFGKNTQELKRISDPAHLKTYLLFYPHPWWFMSEEFQVRIIFPWKLKVSAPFSSAHAEKYGNILIPKPSYLNKFFFFQEILGFLLNSCSSWTFMMSYLDIKFFIWDTTWWDVSIWD